MRDILFVALIGLYLLVPLVYAAFQRPLWLVYPVTLALGLAGAVWAWEVFWIHSGPGEGAELLVIMGWQIGAQVAVSFFSGVNRPRLLGGALLLALLGGLLCERMQPVNLGATAARPIALLTDYWIAATVLMSVMALTDAVAWAVRYRRRKITVTEPESLRP